MNTEVLFENKNNKLVITLNKDVAYEELKEKLQKILDSSDTLFKNVKAPITVTGKRLLDGEETEIEEMIKAKTDLEVKIERPKQMGLATINNIFTKDTTVTPTKVIKGMLRSGRRVDFEGSIVVLGDVNSGAEIIAEGNVIVLGKLRGFAHAGAKGNRSAFIAANEINPTQLRIADIIMKASIDKVDEGLGYECAKMDMGEIKVSK
jgi:septum site-determining protein MinC